jgi:hypothetical protein
MTFAEKMKELFNQGAELTRDLVGKAGAKAQDMGEKGVLRFEIHQLESQAQKRVAALGAELYSLLEEKGQKTVTRETPGIRELLDEIVSLKAAIETRQSELEDGEKKV